MRTKVTALLAGVALVVLTEAARRMRTLVFSVMALGAAVMIPCDTVAQTPPGEFLTRTRVCNDPALFDQKSYSSLNYPDRYIRHFNFLGYLSDPSQPNPNPTVELQDATFDVVGGLACRPNLKSVSLRSRNFPSRWMRHKYWRIRFDEASLGEGDRQRSEQISPATGGRDLFSRDASFEIVLGLAGQCISFRSVNYPDRYIRHRNFELWLDVPDGSDLFRRDATFCEQPPRAGYYPEPR